MTHTIINRRGTIFLTAGGFGRQLFCDAPGKHPLCVRFVLVLVCHSFRISNTALSIQYRSLSVPDCGHLGSICFEFDTLSVWFQLEYVRNDGTLLLWILFILKYLRCECVRINA